MQRRRGKAELASIFILVSLWSGCAANPGAQYGKLQDTDKSRVVPNPEAAIRSAPIIPLEGANKSTVEIGQKDPVVSLGAYESYYKVFRVDARAGTFYKLAIESFCHCLGHTKTMIVPRVYVLDHSGKTIAEGPVETKIHGPGMSSNLKLRGTLDFQVTEDGDYFVLVAADNTRVGAPIETVHDSYWNSEPTKSNPGAGETKELNYDIVSSPVGKVGVQIVEGATE